MRRKQTAAHAMAHTSSPLRMHNRQVTLAIQHHTVGTKRRWHRWLQPPTLPCANWDTRDLAHPPTHSPPVCSICLAAEKRSPVSCCISHALMASHPQYCMTKRPKEGSASDTRCRRGLPVGTRLPGLNRSTCKWSQFWHVDWQHTSWCVPRPLLCSHAILSHRSHMLPWWVDHER